MKRLFLLSLVALLPANALACGDSNYARIDMAILVILCVAAFAAVSLPSCILLLHRLISLKFGMAIISAVTLVCCISFYVISTNFGGIAVVWALCAIGLGLFLPYLLLVVKTVSYLRQQASNR